MGVPLFSISTSCSACSRVFVGDIFGDHAVSCAGLSDFVPGQVVTDAAHRKRVKYEASCRLIGYGFVPFSFSSLGELEKEDVALLKRVQRFSTTQDIGARAAAYTFTRVGFAIARGVGAQIVSRLPNNIL
ncbi:unnamed protein product [Amaranthus hypochondriacus]